MKHFAASLLLVILIVGCSSNPTPAEVEGSPAELVEGAIETMNKLDSYHARLIVPAHPEDVREKFVWGVEYQAPDSYRLLGQGYEGKEKEVCERSGTSTSCRNVMTEITDTTYTEGILVGDMSYGRGCDEGGADCADWQSEPRRDLLVLGPSPSSLPQWPFVVLEMLDEPQRVGSETFDGIATAHLRGNANHIRAILENQRRMLTDAGIVSLFDECDLDDSLDEAAKIEECRRQLYEDSLAMQADGVARLDEDPALVDVWISADGHLHRLELTDGEMVSLTFEYSDFNEITIEAPEEFR